MKSAKWKGKCSSLFNSSLTRSPYKRGLNLSRSSGTSSLHRTTCTNSQRVATSASDFTLRRLIADSGCCIRCLTGWSSILNTVRSIRRSGSWALFYTLWLGASKAWWCSRMGLSWLLSVAVLWAWYNNSLRWHHRLNFMTFRLCGRFSRELDCSLTNYL